MTALTERNHICAHFLNLGIKGTANILKIAAVLNYNMYCWVSLLFSIYNKDFFQQNTAAVYLENAPLV